jgi:hypothetical protein
LYDGEEARKGTTAVVRERGEFEQECPSDPLSERRG